MTLKIVTIYSVGIHLFFVFLFFNRTQTLIGSAKKKSLKQTMLLYGNHATSVLSTITPTWHQKQRIQLKLKLR